MISRALARFFTNRFFITTREKRRAGRVSVESWTVRDQRQPASGRNGWSAFGVVANGNSKTDPYKNNMVVAFATDEKWDLRICDTRYLAPYFFGQGVPPPSR